MKLTLDNLFMYCAPEGACLLWNLGHNSAGKPLARIDGRVVLVQRYVYTELMGKSLERGRRVTTRCLNPSCCSPDCLVGMTCSQIQRRSYKVGQRSTRSEYAARLERFIKQGRTKLTPADVIEIRNSTERPADLAARFGVARTTIDSARSGRSWRSEGHSVFSWRGSCS